MRTTVTQEYLSIKDLVHYCGLSERTIRSYLKNKSLPHFCVGRKILIKKEQFDRWMQSYRIVDNQIDKIVDEITAGF